MPSERLLGLLKEKGFTELTDIQKLAIPVVESGADCLIIAPTGYGKTECALLPIFDFLLAQKETRGVQALYITPLKALNRDMMERIAWWGEKLGITVSVRHGDTTQNERAKQARKPPQLLITTPETLQAMLPSGTLGKALERVEKVVVDEVHELYAEKRGAQLSLALERLLEKRGGRAYQRIGLSATVGKPEKVGAFLCGDRPCRIIRLPVERAIHLTVESPVPTEKDYKLGGKLGLDGAAAARLRRMDELIRSHEATLAFVNTRSIAETLASRLFLYRQEYSGPQDSSGRQDAEKVGVHHGSLARDARLGAEEKFKGRELQGLICTSSLELGMDIGRVDLVIQYSSPRQAQRLVQRVGRSGHSISRIPKGIVLAADEDDTLEAAVVARRSAKGLIEGEDEQAGALDVLAHQVAGMLLEKKEGEDVEARTAASILSVVKRAHPFSEIREDDVRAVARQLESEGLINFEEKLGLLKANGRTRFYYYENLSMIPDQRRLFMKSAVTNSNVAMLDEAFVANFVQPGATIISRGVPWKVLDVAENEVIVEPSQDVSAAIPDWVGEEIPVTFETAQEVGVLRRKIAAGDAGVAAEYFLTPEAAHKLSAFVERQKKTLVSDEKDVLVEGLEEAVVVHSLLGTRGNGALARLLSPLASLRALSPVRAESDAYHVVLRGKGVDAAGIALLIRQVSPEYAEKTVLDAVPKSPLFRIKFVQVAKAFGLIARDADYKNVGIGRIIDVLVGSPVYRETARQYVHDYLDLHALKRFVRDVREGRVILHPKRVGAGTPFARAALEKVSAGSELLGRIEPASEILKSFKYGILGKQVKLFCTYCNSVSYRELEKMGEDEKLACPNCGSQMLAPVDPGDEDFPKLQKKLKVGKKNLTPAEKKLRNELLRVAGIIQTYGRRGIAALKVYGVGPDVAARVLRKMHPNEDQMFIDLLEAQKLFIRTKRYWSE